MREIRLQSEVALQRLLALMEAAAAGESTMSLSRALHDKLLLAVRLIGDLLDPAKGQLTPRDRLNAVCQNMLLVHGDPDAEIDLRVVADSGCPAALEEVVLAVAEMFVSNAICHGLHARLLGRIDVRLVATASGTALSVSDDGWGMGGTDVEIATSGGGLAHARVLAEQHGGTIRVHRSGGRTMAELVLPNRRPVTT